MGGNIRLAVELISLVEDPLVTAHISIIVAPCLAETDEFRLLLVLLATSRDESVLLTWFLFLETRGCLRE